MKKVYITVFIAILIILFAPLVVKAAGTDLYGNGFEIELDGTKASEKEGRPRYYKVTNRTWNYTGNLIKPVVFIRSPHGYGLVKDKDYTVEYLSTNTALPGEKYITIRGKGDYTGTIHVTFEVTREESSSANQDFDPDAYNPNQRPITTTQLKNKARTVVAVIRNIGIVISVIALMVIGFKQMTASAEEKSILKQAMPGYILGVILVAGITFLPTIIYQFSKGLW